MSLVIFPISSGRSSFSAAFASWRDPPAHPVPCDWGPSVKAPSASRAVLGAGVFLALIAWAPSMFACDLAIVLDHSGSMGDKVRSDGHTRCADAACYATTVFNYYRCGAATCQVTTAATPVNILVDGTVPTFDIVYNDPSNGCSSIAGKRVNVFAFNGLSGIVTTSNFAASLDSSGATVFAFHA